MSLFNITDQALGQEPRAAATAQASGSAATRIEVDEQAGVIRFFIEGQETAHLDAGGLHVREGLNYGGALTDYGQAGFHSHIGRKDGKHRAQGDDNAP